MPALHYELLKLELNEKWQMQACGCKAPGSDARLCCAHLQAQVEMADAALWLYGIAFEEVKRHIGVECRERSQVLACLWDHCCCLTELRCAVQYEGLLAHSRKGFQGLADQRQYLKGQIR